MAPCRFSADVYVVRDREMGRRHRTALIAERNPGKYPMVQRPDLCLGEIGISMEREAMVRRWD